MATMPRRYGLLLPHFGAEASPDKIIRGAQKAEQLGFDSLWVRDHVIFRPHGMEGTDRTHVEPLTVVSAVAASTKRITLGTASLIPYHHPVYLANQLAAFNWFFGDRLIVGFGIGYRDIEFEAMGLGGIPRDDLLEEQVAIMRKLWTGKELERFDGKFYTIPATIDAHPSPTTTIPIWYCGNSPAAARRAVEYCDGFMPGRLNLPTYVKRVSRIRRLAGEAGKPMPTLGVIPITSPGRTREEGLSKVNLAGFLEDANHMVGRWVTPASGKFEKPEDLEGALIVGSPQDIAGEVEKLHAAAISTVIFDFRFRFDEWDECIEIVGGEVVPLLRRGGPVTV